MEDLEESLAEDGTDDEPDHEVADQGAPSLADADKTLSTGDVTPDPAEDEAKLKAIAEIQTVIISLDQENPEHFTTKGKPKVEAVRTRMPDVEVSADDVAEAYKGLEVG